MDRGMSRRSAMLVMAMACLMYFASYVTRINFAAVVVEFVKSEQVPKPEASVITTALFVTYGAGQLISGFLGDRMPPWLLILFGLGVASVCNLLLPAVAPGVGAMAAVWGVNGFAQACMWPPLVKILKRVLTPEEYIKYVPFVSVASSLASISVYLVAPLIIRAASWRSVFSVCAGVGGLCTALWLALCLRLLRGVDFNRAAPAPQARESAGESGNAYLVRAAFTLLPVILITIAIQGMLRDGISTWTPTFLTETFHLETTVVILTSIALPVFHAAVNLFTARVHSAMHNRTFSCLALYFALVTAFLGLLWAAGARSAALSLILIAAGNGLTHGINLIQTCYIPALFDARRVSFYAGLLNSATYVGSALSTWLFATLSEHLGWHATVFSWALIAAAGLLLSLLCRARCERRA